MLRKTLARDRTAQVGLLFVVVIALAAIFAPIIAPYDPREQSIVNRLDPPSSKHLLGTDEFGRDVLSRVVWGARYSLAVGLIAVVVAMTIGVTIGIVAGFVGGKVDLLISQVIDALLAFPALLLGMLVVAVLGTGLENTVVAIAVSLVPQFARLTRGPTMSAKQEEYVQASRALGLGSSRILLRHVLPNIVGPLVIMATLWVGTAIRMEASLSFLGLGIQPPTPSWGSMIKVGVERISRAPWLAIYPSLAIIASVFSFNLIGDALRDMLDPRTRRSR